MLTDVSFIIALYVGVRLLCIIYASGPNEQPPVIRRIVAPLALLLVIAFSVSIGINANKIVKGETTMQHLFSPP